MDAAVYDLFRAHDDDNWYLSAREDVLAAFVRRFCPLSPTSVILDVGAGTGRILTRVAPRARAVAMETDGATASFGRERYGLPFVRGDLEAGLPFRDASADLVLLLDVLEHLDDDRRLLADVARVLRPGGRAVIAVPAFRSLWSRHDELHHHRRRYRRGDVRRLLEATGLACRYLGYYNSILFPLIFGVRMLQRAHVLGQSGTDYERPPAATRHLLGWAFRQERRLITRWRLPLGVSLLALAEPR